MIDREPGTVERNGSVNVRAPKKRVRYVRSIDQIANLPPETRILLERVTQRYAFRANDYYLGLIDWSDPKDPIRQLIIPREEELNEWGKLDASNETSVTVSRGVQHKYQDTVLLLCNEVCGAYCRYCFRKRLFMNDNDEVSNDVSAGIRYIAENRHVTNVLLTGGDPLLMSNRKIGDILKSLRNIDHVKVIRFGSKMPAFDPYRLLDSELLSLFKRYSSGQKRIYLMAHFDHPRELTDLAMKGLSAAMNAGVIAVNQNPMIRGINDDADVLSEMYAKLSYAGVPPYYLFQGRPTAGNEPYEVRLVEAWNIFNEAISQGSGLARRARFVMSHETGKIEVVGVDEERIYLRYHQSKYKDDVGRFFVCQRDDEAYWLDQLVPLIPEAESRWYPADRN